MQNGIWRLWCNRNKMQNILKIYKKVSPLWYPFHGRIILWVFHDFSPLPSRYHKTDTTISTSVFMYTWLFGKPKFSFDTKLLKNLSLAVKRKKVEADKIPKHTVKFRIFRKVFQEFKKQENLNIFLDIVYTFL